MGYLDGVVIGGSGGSLNQGPNVQVRLRVPKVRIKYFNHRKVKVLT